MAGPSTVLARHSIAAPAVTQMAPLPAEAAQAAKPHAHDPEPQQAAGSAADHFVEAIRKVTCRAKLYGAVMAFELEGIDPAGVIDGLKALDPAVEFETSFGGKGYGGGRKGDKRATVNLILIRKYGADVTGKTPEGEDVTASIWKNKVAEVLGALPLNDDEKAKVAKGIEGKLNPAMLSLEGRGFEMTYWKGDKDGVESFNVSEIIAPTNGNGHGASQP